MTPLGKFAPLFTLLKNFVTLLIPLGKVDVPLILLAVLDALLIPLLENIDVLPAH